jgi:predicted phosphoribosyltransferase
MYRNRADAATLLAEKLEQYRGTHTIVLAIPRGGISVGFVIAKLLHLPLEITMAKKIGHPDNPEYAIGAVSLDDTSVDEMAPLPYIRKETNRLRKEMSARQQQLMGRRALTPLEGMNVILVDDGIATGRTLKACVKSIRRQHPARLIIAAPVASAQSAHELRTMADEFVCPLVSSDFYAVGQFYDHFDEVTDDEVKALLAQAANGFQES